MVPQLKSYTMRVKIWIEVQMGFPEYPHHVLAAMVKLRLLM
jgi:hypothetical protein